MAARLGGEPVDKNANGDFRMRADRAMVPMLPGCGLRRSELLSVTMKTIQQREDHLPGSPAKRISDRKV
jgi:site-specific recombinase XerC